MNLALGTLENEYTLVIQEYAAGAHEVALARAYELGRRAVSENLGLVEVAAIHHNALLSYLLQSATPEQISQLANAAAEVFAETLAPFEMVHRGFQEAHETLRRMNEALEGQVAERTAEIQRQLNRLTALRYIDLAITGSLDLRVTLNVFLDQVTSHLSVDAAGILLLNPHTQMLEYAAARGFRSRAIQQVHLRLGEGLPGHAALERRTISVPNLAQEATSGVRGPLVAAEGFVAFHATPLIAKGQVKGVVEVFHRAPLETPPDWLDFLEALAGQAAIAVDNATLFVDLQRTNVSLAMAYDTTLEGWSRALDLRDKETEGHTQRVAELTVRLARVMGMGEEDLVHVRRGALLHDIGKMGIPDGILLKPGSLTPEEWEIMKKHPTYAHELLSPIAYLRPALHIPYSHHEKWDGTGYPRGLKGEQIQLEARVFAVVDVYDALTADRPYRKAWPKGKALTHIQEQAGAHFDPQVVDAFVLMMESAS